MRPSCESVRKIRMGDELNRTPDRRDFLKAALVTGFPAIISAQTVTNAIKVGLVGCGGRGSGAARQALQADDYTELTAVADIDQAQIAKCLENLKRVSKLADRVKADNQFLGLDAYQKVIEQRRRRGAARHAAGVSANASGRLHRREQARLLRKADLDRCARRPLGARDRR